MSSFYTEIAEILSSGEKVAMASITMQRGSSPRDRGARCAVRADGSVIGTIGGGLMEALTQKAGVESLRDGRLRYLEMDLDSKDLAGSEMICGGSLAIMVTPWGAEEVEVARKLADVSNGLLEGILLTRWDSGSDRARLEFLDGAKPASLEGPLAKLLEDATSTGRTTVKKDEDGGAAFEPMGRELLPLIVLGGGHVGRALGEAASSAGFYVSIVDERGEFASRDLHPEAHEVICAPFDSYLAELYADSHTFIVIVTRGHRTDIICALASLRSDAGYVGMIGSRRKGKIIIDHLKESKISEERLQDFHTPVGLSIGAQTPGEIAVSILAEMIKIRREKAL